MTNDDRAAERVAEPLELLLAAIPVTPEAALTTQWIYLPLLWINRDASITRRFSPWAGAGYLVARRRGADAAFGLVGGMGFDDADRGRAWFFEGLAGLELVAAIHRIKTLNHRGTETQERKHEKVVWVNFPLLFHLSNFLLGFSVPLW